MEFISWQFIIFFLIAMMALLSDIKHKKIILCIFNIVFYAFAGVEGLLILLCFCTITYAAGRKLENNKSKIWLTICIIVSLLPLLFYKYSDFVLSDCLNIKNDVVGNLAVPLGISFITFQGVGYLVDVFKGRCRAEKNIVNYFIYLSLFTTVTSGPINRAEHMLKQIREYDQSKFDYDRCVKGFVYVLIGIFLKLMISSRMAQVVSGPFSTPETTEGLELLIASICFTIQIFCDFCGYSYMAYGLSKIIGLDVIQNFERPYHSVTITEFWRRWHISLSSWLRDYIYFPLGGSRCSKIRSYTNILIVFTISGLWHGAAWNYIFWGLLNGILIVAEKVVGLEKTAENKVIRVCQKIVTLVMIGIMWIFFRAESINDGFLIIYKICTGTLAQIKSVTSVSGIFDLISNLGIRTIDVLPITVSIIAYLIFELTMNKKDDPTEFFESRNLIIRWVKYVAIMLAILMIGSTGQTGDFIYANF